MSIAVESLRLEPMALLEASRARILDVFDGREAVVLSPAPELGPPSARASNFHLALVDGYLGESEGRFDHLIFVLLTESHADTDRPAILIVGPDKLAAFAERAKAGRRTNSLVLWRGAGVIRSLGAVLYRAPRSAASSRLMREIEKLGSALNFHDDYPGSVKLGLTLTRRLETLNHLGGVERLLGGFHEQRAELGNESYLAFLSSDSDEKGERKLWINEQQLHVGSSREIAIPWRYCDYCLLRMGPEPVTLDATRSIMELRNQYALTVGSVAKEEDKSVVRQHLEREALLRKRRELTYRFGRENLKRFPVVTPIALEVAGNLTPLVASDEQKLSPKFQELVDMMRDGLLYELGHERLPGIRVRGNTTDLPDGTYIVMLSEIPIVSGNVRLDRVLVNDTAKRLNLLNFKAEEAVNPANGSKCAWIGAEHARIAEQAGLTTWDAAGYIILHIASVLRKNFADFVTVQNVVGQVKAKAPNLLQQISDSLGGVGRFTGVLKCLAEEEVKLTKLEKVCRLYLTLQEREAPIYEIIEELRMIDELRQSLHGNRGDEDVTVVYLLGDDVVKLIREGSHTSGNTARLMLTPENTQEILTAVRNEVGNLPPTSQNPVVLVEDWRLRRHVRRLVELEFPHLPVMASREGLKRVQPISRISLE